MTRAELIADIVTSTESTQKDATEILEIILNSMVRALRAGDKIEIRGFGSFGMRGRRPRIGRNPRTGKRVDVPAKRAPFFKPSSAILAVLNSPPSIEASRKLENISVPPDPV